jgi:ribosomal protein S7
MRCIYAEDVKIADCSVCGATCAPEVFWLHWAERPGSICIQLATVATEMAAGNARTCEQWAEWRTKAIRLMTRTLENSPTKHATRRLVATTSQIIHRRTKGADIAELCQAIGAHHPADGETARIVGADQPTKVHKPWWRNRRASWVRCEKHGTWCAVGLHSDIYGRYERMREILALHWIAAHSRSCEEFRARRKTISETIRTMAFAPAGPKGRWTRNDQTEEKKMLLAHATAKWSDLAPALGPWATIVAKALGGEEK